VKIGISTSVIQRGQTGIAQYVFALIRAFIAAGSRQQFVLFVLEEDLPLFQFAASAMQLVSVPESFRRPEKNILWHQFCLPRLARQHGIEVLHVPSYRRLLWLRPCALVATIHDLAPFRVARKYEWKRMVYGRVVVRRLAERQDEIIAISHNTGADIAEFFRLNPERVHVVYNGVEHTRFFPIPREQAKALMNQLHNLSRPFFLYVARLEHPGKNHVRLITAFNQFKAATKSNWQLVLAGSAWSGSKVIERAIAQSPVSQDIRRLGFIAYADLPKLYQAADTFVFPSLYEGFGLPALEAMACGCPVLSSTRGSLGEVIADAAETVDPEDMADLERQLTRLATDVGLRERLRAAGLKRAQQFNWQTTAEATLETYGRAFSRFKSVRGPRKSLLPPQVLHAKR
jgi:glycosyltransferase involved in cell wall biosynthesis